VLPLFLVDADAQNSATSSTVSCFYKGISMSNPSNTILVTGANGNIGQALTASLAQAGQAFVRMSSKPATGAHASTTRVADFADAASLRQAFEGVDTLFLLFPLVENKLELARNAAQAAKAAGVRHIVRSSGAGADATSSFALPRFQGQIDEVLAATGIPTTFLRPAGFMQNYGTYQAQAIAAGHIYMADGGQAQSLIDARDIGAAAAQVLLNPAAHAGKAYTLTGSQSITGAQAAQVLSAALGRNVNHTSVATADAVATMQQWNMPAWLIELMDSLNQIVSAGYASGVSPDVEHILGRPGRSFEHYVREVLQPQLAG
jgi:uncharacterized protein YbjT (DUF2867 family)